MLNIYALRAFNDNYIWVCVNAKNNNAIVVDPGDATPVIKDFTKNKLKLSAILITHHHFDHSGGIPALLDFCGYKDLNNSANNNIENNVKVYAPAKENIQFVTEKLQDLDQIQVLDNMLDFKVMEVPGHTLGHVTYVGCLVGVSARASSGSVDIGVDTSAGSGAVDKSVLFGDKIAFCGDTLFAGGCGRIFEGSALQMYNSLNKLKNLAKDTKMYCAHEYTLANLNFAKHVEPNNNYIIERIEKIKKIRSNDEPSIPSTMAEELLTNPFLRTDQKEVIDTAKKYTKQNDLTAVEVFAAIRKMKDCFV